MADDFWYDIYKHVRSKAMRLAEEVGRLKGQVSDLKEENKILKEMKGKLEKDLDEVLNESGS